MTCPGCNGYAHTGYDRRGRPKPCLKCRGTGKIGEDEPPKPPDYKALIP
jgi:DnaJ-class molecular chaperone